MWCDVISDFPIIPGTFVYIIYVISLTKFLCKVNRKSSARTRLFEVVPAPRLLTLSTFNSIEIPTSSKLLLKSTQLAFTCSKLAIEAASEQCLESVRHCLLGTNFTELF